MTPLEPLLDPSPRTDLLAPILLGPVIALGLDPLVPGNEVTLLHLLDPRSTASGSEMTLGADREGQHLGILSCEVFSAGGTQTLHECLHGVQSRRPGALIYFSAVGGIIVDKIETKNLRSPCVSFESTSCYRGPYIFKHRR